MLPSMAHTLARARQDDTVDSLCWRHYGATRGLVEAVLQANPGLADAGPMLPQGMPVRMPVVTARPVQPVIQLWD